MFSPISPTEILAILLTEFLFGVGYNQLVAWGQDRLWHVSISVVVGVAVTLAIPAAVWWGTSLDFWKTATLLTLCFAASGAPMVYGSMQRTVKSSHKRRPWPTAALRARDDAIMQLSSLAHEISDEARQGTLKAGHLPDYVNRLHEVIGTLKSV